MILPRTLIKLRESDATIYRVTMPAQQAFGVEIPAASEVFATSAQADKAVRTWNGTSLKGAKSEAIKARDHSDPFLKDWKDYA